MREINQSLNVAKSKVAIRGSSIQPKTEKGRKKRESLLVAARKTFSTKGFFDTRVSDIAEEAGVSLGNFYQYFRDRDDVLQVLMEDFERALFSSSGRQEVIYKDPYYVLEQGVRGLFLVYSENADLYKILRQVVQADIKYEKMLIQMRRPFHRRVYKLLKGVPEFDRSGISPNYAATALLNMLNQSAYTWIVKGWELESEKIELDDAVQTITALWYRAIFGAAREVEKDNNRHNIEN